MAHHGFGLDVEVAEHLVGLPSAKKADPIRVHVRTKESHGARCPQGAGRHVQGAKAVGGAQDNDREP